MGSYLVYSPTTGIIDRTGGAPDGEEMMQAQAGEAVMLTPGSALRGNDYYVDLGPPPVLMTKDVMPTSIDVTYIAAGATQTATISDVPEGAEFYVDGVDHGRVDDGSVTFSAVVIGSYDLLLTHYRYLDQAYVVDVGIAQLAAAIEIEYGVSVRAPLAAATEIEAGLAAGQARTTQLVVATETEAALSASVSVVTYLDVAAEIEKGVDASAPLEPASETEAALDAVLSNVTQLSEAVETETALAAAA